MGFQHMLPVVHKAASGKGGRVRKKKGIATLSDERRSEIASLGGKARHENSNREPKQTQDKSSSEHELNLADVLGALDE